ncbi:hypothetical protein, partial [Siphonobacter sp. BAB-5385]|uniref:hypothetical protein n=1 Tax=Siphonobacter sp. BAB-5385 TaxID=1864822 RepID=UPI0034E95CBD
KHFKHFKHFKHLSSGVLTTDKPLYFRMIFVVGFGNASGLICRQFGRRSFPCFGTKEPAPLPVH